MSKSVLLRGLLLRAWRERWNDCQWGLNIKKILPRGVSGDAYNLADCILQQAVVGSGANQLILSYLRHSLCSHLISYASVLKWISNYENPEHHNYLLLSLLDFVDSIIPAVTCSNRQEESLMMDATNNLIRWLWQVYSRHADQSADSEQLLQKLSHVLEKICQNDFMLGIFCLARVDNETPIRDVATALATRGKPLNAIDITIQRHFQALVDMTVEQLPMMKIERKSSAAITHILQPLLVVELLKNPSNEQRVTSQLLLVQNLKRFTRSQFFCEILRSCLLTLQNVNDTSREPLWCAFTFIKMPQILKQLLATGGGGGGDQSMDTDANRDLLEAIDLLLEESSLLDILDFKCGLNTVEVLLKEFQKHGLVTDKHTEHYAAKREGISANVQKLDPTNQTKSTVKYVIRADQPLAGILKTLNTDYNKVQEALLSMLFQVTHGNSLELIMAVATVEGKLRTVVSRLIKSNECSKQIAGETGKPAVTRAALFDVTFLYLVYIVQTYGADLVLDEHGDSFFETWVRHAMVNRRRMKSAMSIVRGCDTAKVDELLMHLMSNSGSGGGAPLTMRWHEVVDAIPGMLYQVLVAWENGLAAHDVKVILDNLKCKMGAYSVCAVSWLCAYLHAVNEEEHPKPLSMIQQLMTVEAVAGAEKQLPKEMEHLKERVGLTNQIIRQMQSEFQSRAAARGQKLEQQQQQLRLANFPVVSSSPLEETFSGAWEQIADRKWLSVEVAQTLERLYESCGAFWLVQRLVQELDKCKYVTEIDQATDIVFSLMHLDIEAMTMALVGELLPVLMAQDLSHPYTTALARLCVYVILSAVESGGQQATAVTKKRGRMGEAEEGGVGGGGVGGMEPIMKIRKMDSEFPEDFSNAAAAAALMDTTTTGAGGLKGAMGGGGGGGTVTSIRDPLCSTIKEMLKRFSQYVQSDEYSPRVNFVFEFVTILVECRRCDAVPVLRLIPTGLVQNLLKVMPLANIKAGLVLQLYDLSLASGRQAALSDLCVLRRSVQNVKVF